MLLGFKRKNILLLAPRTGIHTDQDYRPTSSDKALLYFPPKNRVEKILDQQGMARFTDNTIVDRKQLFRELKICRSRGYTVDVEEESVRVKCGAPAIRTPAGDIAEALSISGAVQNMTDNKYSPYAGLLLSAAHTPMLYAHHFPAIELRE